MYSQSSINDVIALDLFDEPEKTFQVHLKHYMSPIEVELRPLFSFSGSYCFDCMGIWGSVCKYVTIIIML